MVLWKRQVDLFFFVTICQNCPKMKLSLIIPACNEEGRIGPMLDRYLPFFLDRYGSDVEFVVVVNGNQDGAEGVVQGYKDRFPLLNCLIESGSIGKGGAVMVGINRAQGELVGFVDADGSTPPEAFQDLVERMEDADAIIASRWCSGADVSPKQPLRRRIASRGFNLITRILFGLRLTDTQCGAKLMRREAVLRVMPELGVTQWAFDVDMLFQLRRHGYRIREIPTVWHDVEGSKLEVVRVSVEMFFALVRLRLAHSPFRGLVKFYNPRFFPFIHRHDEEEQV